MSEKEDIAREISERCLVLFSANFPYFSRALSSLEIEIDENTDSVYTDGKKIGINPEYLLSFVAEVGNSDLIFIHLLLHCLFLHPFEEKEDENYDLACDMTVAYVTDELKLYSATDKKYNARKSAYKAVIDKFDGFNEKFASIWLLDKDIDEKDKLVDAFKICDHTKWREKTDESVAVGINGDGNDSEEKKTEWRMIAEELIKNLPSSAGSLVKLLKANRVGIDYLSVLKRFLFSSERLKTDPDQFDYIYYCLGLERYGNMPLIENLEYREDKNFKDIVLAVDTSGSTKGEPISRFIDEIYSLVKAYSERSGEKYRLRIIQCDCKITEDLTIESEQKFESVMKNFEVKGGGGTDFRPVFDLLYFDGKKGRRTKALVYFTDGFGAFPEKDLGIKTVFALYGENAEKIKIPYFAYKIIIGGEYS